MAQVRLLLHAAACAAGSPICGMDVHVPWASNCQPAGVGRCRQCMNTPGSATSNACVMLVQAHCSGAQARLQLGRAWKERQAWGHPRRHASAAAAALQQLVRHAVRMQVAGCERGPHRGRST